MKLIIDNRERNRNTDTVINDIDKQSTQKILSKLNGENHTLVSLNRDDGWFLMVGGGPDRFIITLGNHANNLTLSNKEGDEKKSHEICAGGQFGEYPENICISYENTKNAIESFFDYEEELLDWS